MENNKGVTLVELLVTMTMVVVVGTALLGFFQISNRFYKASNAEVNLQYEAQTALNKIQNMVMDSTAGLCYNVGTESYSEMVYADHEFVGAARSTVELTNKGLYIFNVEEQEDGTLKKIVSSVTWEKATSELFYSQYTYTGTVEVTSEKYLLASYIDQFQVDLTKLDTEKKITIYIDMINGNKTYKTDLVIMLRNNVKVNQEIEEIFKDVVIELSTITGVTVIPSVAIVTQGGTQTFVASVEGTIAPSQKVKWSVIGYNDETEGTGTRINTETGELTLGSKETSQSIQVVATSLANNSVSSDPANVRTKYFDNITLSDHSVDNDIVMKATITGNLLKKENCGIEWQVSTNNGFTDHINISKNTVVEYDTGAVDGFSQYKETATFSMSELTEGQTYWFRTVATQYGSFDKGVSNVVSFTVPEKPKRQPKSIDISKIDGIQNKGDYVYRGDTVSFEAIVRDQDGNQIENQEVSWNVEILNTSINKNDIASKINFDVSGLDYNNPYSLVIKATITDTNISSVIEYVIPKVSISIEPCSDNFYYLIEGKSAEFKAVVEGVNLSSETIVWETVNTDTSNNMTIEKAERKDNYEKIEVICESIAKKQTINLEAKIEGIKDSYSIDCKVRNVYNRKENGLWENAKIYVPYPNVVITKLVQQNDVYLYTDMWGNKFYYEKNGNNWRYNSGNTIFKYNNDKWIMQ